MTSASLCFDRYFRRKAASCKLNFTTKGLIDPAEESQVQICYNKAEKPPSNMHMIGDAVDVAIRDWLNWNITYEFVRSEWSMTESVTVAMSANPHSA
jgi:hypothetical protein